MEIEERQLGQIVDQLGVRGLLEKDDIVTDVLVLARVANTETGERLAAWESEGLSFILRRGMVRVAEDMEVASALTTVSESLDDEEL